MLYAVFCTIFVPGTSLGVANNAHSTILPYIQLSCSIAQSTFAVSAES